jgi:hypothetical protein
VSQYSSSSLRWWGQHGLATHTRNGGRQTHGVEALDVVDVLVDEKAHLCGHVCGAGAARARDERHEGGSWRRGEAMRCDARCEDVAASEDEDDGVHEESLGVLGRLARA